MNSLNAGWRLPSFVDAALIKKKKRPQASIFSWTLVTHANTKKKSLFLARHYICLHSNKFFRRFSILSCAMGKNPQLYAAYDADECDVCNPTDGLPKYTVRMYLFLAIVNIKKRALTQESNFSPLLARLDDR